MTANKHLRKCHKFITDRIAAWQDPFSEFQPVWSVMNSEVVIIS